MCIRDRTITVVDTTSPVLIAPEDLIIEAESTLTQIENLGEFTAEDISGITTVTNDAPEVFPLGETIVTWTATDSSGNSASDSQQITVLDRTVPSITIPSDIEVEIYDKLGVEIDTGIAVSDDIIDSQPTVCLLYTSDAADE